MTCGLACEFSEHVRFEVLLFFFKGLYFLRGGIGGSESEFLQSFHQLFLQCDCLRIQR